MNILITGGAGFIGSCFVREWLTTNPNDIVVCLDALTYAGSLHTLAEVQHNHNFVFVHGNIQDTTLIEFILRKYKIEGVVNFAAETHVDRSLHDANPFLDTNVSGCLALMQTASRCNVRRFVHVSTDEVYGSIPIGSTSENAALAPSSPYSESKAQADEKVLAASKQIGRMSIMITRSSNNYGPYQHPEKFIPIAITNLLQHKKIPLYGTGLNVRDWLFVEDNCRAIANVLLHGRHGEVYNIGSSSEKTNKEIVSALLPLLKKDESSVEPIADRKNHDLRYSVNWEKIKHELGWKPSVSFEEGMALTVEWYAQNSWWWRIIRDDLKFKEYEQKHYVQLHGMKSV